ncbi:MAG: HDIG domain-containing protein [Anaerolineaceae bacterium]|nr:HDIG domain-containing protein [Anaerolineaceae bacterium]
MKRADALTIVHDYIKNRNLINHMYSVEAAMQFYAKKLDQDELTWGITGLLHDFDWEIHSNLDEHPLKGAQILRDRETPEEIIRAILSHGYLPEYPRETLMEKALSACDEITGLITAVALVRPSKSLYDLKPKSVKKKWKDRSFAAGANREEIAQTTQEFGVDLWGEHVGNIIVAMQTIAPEIDLAGNIAPNLNQ